MGKTVSHRLHGSRHVLMPRTVAHALGLGRSRYCFGHEPLVTINAFSMGAWATGFNMPLALNRNGVVKSTGPDIEKILSTLRFLGPGYRYLICGYPPFVKHLLDLCLYS